MSAIIAGQWGTTRLNAFLIESGVEIDARTGPGAALVHDRSFEQARAVWSK